MKRPLLVLASLLLPQTLLAEAPARGHVLAIGGGERPLAVMAEFAHLAGSGQGVVLAFPQASERSEAGAELKQEFLRLGIGRVEVMDVDRAGADSDGALARTQGATGVYFGGGDQSRLMAVLRGTRLEARLHELYRTGAVIAGTSAGAAVMSRTMIVGDETRPFSKDDAWQTIEAENVVTAAGLGFLEGAIVDQHFVRRKRHNRLISLVLENPRLLGVAIDEETAALFRPDGTFEVIGNGPVVVYDAGAARVQKDAGGFGLRGSDLRLHILRAGSVYDVSKRSVVRLGPDSR
jgi:cyanophycinase